MIIYHPAYDVHHCSYRIMNILYHVDKNELSIDMLKFVDFYYLYPHLLKKVEKLPRPLCYQKAKICNIKDPFEITDNPKSLYFELTQMQKAALNSLGYKSIISKNIRMIKLNIEALPKGLIDSFERDEFSKTDIFEVLVRIFPKVHLNGPSGFKAKSGLMEFRYG